MTVFFFFQLGKKKKKKTLLAGVKAKYHPVADNNKTKNIFTKLRCRLRVCPLVQYKITTVTMAGHGFVIKDKQILGRNG